MKAFHTIRTILYKRQGLACDIKMILYKQLLRPILTYGFPIWFDISSSQMEKIRLLERKLLRIITHTSRKDNSFLFINNNKLYAKAKVERIDRLLVRNNIRFFNRMTHEQIQLLSDDNIVNEHFTNDAYKYKSPFYFRYLTNNNLLYDNSGRLTYYHRRYRGLGLVYNMNQNI